MKKLLYTFAFVLIAAGLSAQDYVVHKEFGQAWGGGASIDLDADGDLDFYITGSKNNPPQALLDEDGNPLDLNNDGVNDTTERWQRLVMNTESGYVVTPTSLRVVDRANLDWYDVDGDGLLDLLGTEHSFSFYHGGVYKNHGDGTFTKMDWPLDARSNAGAFADFNMDGHIDYIAVSQDTAATFVYINNGDDTFEATNGDIFGSIRYGLGYVEVIDFNNDALPDIFLSANVDNIDMAGANGGARVISDIFINNDEEPGTFYRAFIGDNGIYQKSNGGVDFADFNNDGYMDFALHGEGGTGTGEPAGGGWECISHVYINQQDGTFLDKAQPAFPADIRPLGSTGVGTGIIDWNNDGNWDLVLTGWEPEYNTQTGWLFTGDGAGNFSEVGRVPGASETVLLFLDWNADGVKDYLVSGHSWDAMWYSEANEEVGRTGAVYFNKNTGSPNVPPAAPANLTSERGVNKFTLSWDAPTDDNTDPASLTYEYYLKDGDGNYMIAPSSIVGGALDGKRMVNKLGNAFYNTSITLYDLEVGEYTWSVQAIDASYDGSAFAEEVSFSVFPLSVQQNELESLMNVYTRHQEVVVSLQTDQPAELSIYNLNGQLITGKQISGEYTQSLRSGVYFVKVMLEGKVAVEKVIIAD